LAATQAPGQRPFSLDDVARIQTISGPAIAPDDGWVSYTVASIDTVRDREQSDIWMTSWDGTRSIRLTSSPESEYAARWSPDGPAATLPADRRARTDRRPVHGGARGHRRDDRLVLLPAV